MLFNVAVNPEAHKKLAQIALGQSSDRLIDLTDVIARLREGSDAGDTHWVDVGAGPGIAQVEAHLIHKVPNLLTTAVDIYPYNPAAYFSAHEVDTLSVTSPKNGRPLHRWLQADAASFTIDYPADLMTSVYSIPYWRQPFESIVNIYNQLRPGGLMAVVTDYDYPWTAGVGGRVANEGQRGPAIEFLEVLRQAGVVFDINGVQDLPWSNNGIDYSALHIKRKVNTTLELTAERIGEDDHNNDLLPECYKIVRYDVGLNESPIMVIDTD